MSWINKCIRTFNLVVTDIKAFLHRQRWKEALIFFSFVLLSFAFWVLQSLKLEYETEMSIPIRYKNVPADIILNNDVPNKAIIRIEDKGSVLLNYTVGQKFRTIDIDLEKLPKDKEEKIITKKIIENEIQKQIFATTTLYDFEPQIIHIRYGLRESREYPIVFNGNIQTENGFLVSSDIQIEPAKVTVYGSKALLDSIKEVKTVFFEVENAKKNIKKSIRLLPIDGANLELSNATITIPIEEFTEKKLKVPVIIKDVPDNYQVRTFPKIVEISCSIPISRFNELTEDMFAIEIPFSGLEENVSGSLDVNLSKKPEWVKFHKISPTKIEFLLEAKIKDL